MKRILLYVLVPAVLFGASAGVSWWWQRRGAGATAATSASQAGSPSSESAAESPEPAATGETSNPADERVAVRLSHPHQVEAAIQLMTALEKRREELRRQEETLAQRQKNLELLYNDIRAERAALDALRKQIQEEMRLLEAQAQQLEQKQQELQRHKEEVSERLKDYESSLRHFEDTERKNLEALAERVSNMAPENAAKLFEHMANSGNMDTAVKLFSLVKETRAAKILEQMPPDLATQIIERIKLLKRPATKPGSLSKS
jgi:flagellar motility protein MotE (MotC chaperone)